MRMTRGHGSARRIRLTPQILDGLQAAALGLRYIPQYEQCSQHAHASVNPIRKSMIEHGIQHRVAVQHLKDADTSRLAIHCAATAMPIALPLMALGNISDSITQATGPHDSAKPAM